MNYTKGNWKRVSLARLITSAGLGLELYSLGQKGRNTKKMLKEGIEFCDEMGSLVYLVESMEKSPEKIDISNSKEGRRNFQNLYVYQDFKELFSREEFNIKIVSKTLKYMKKELSKTLYGDYPLGRKKLEKLNNISRYMSNNLWEGFRK